MNKKILHLTTSALLVLFSFVANVAQGADTGTVTATVTPQSISVSVTDGAVTYGTLSTSTSKSTISTDLNDTQTATNDGNVTADLNIRGQDSANWTLAAAAGANQYVHAFCTATCGTPPTNFTALTTSNQTLASGVAASASQTFELRLTTPTSTSVTTQQSVDVTIQATE
jgi:hypothetical protein